MTKITIVHNPRCSKSRQTLQLLQEQGYQPEIVEYLKQPLSAKTLKQYLDMLGFDSARQLMRKNEDEYKQLNLSDEQLGETELIDVMVSHPKLIERPIVIANQQARIGRPPESVLEIL
ncbi:arsenate reductase (glutaredoxin) [Neptunicella sp. SCSIO 80796]|uniref:arsenate reductase (glutaredoxin) n=1 Tax=Neptunicella plasticusilytica TaxID=3117012 RepID=UPI003A4D40C2